MSRLCDSLTRHSEYGVACLKLYVSRLSVNYPLIYFIAHRPNAILRILVNIVSSSLVLLATCLVVRGIFLATGGETLLATLCCVSGGAALRAALGGAVFLAGLRGGVVRFAGTLSGSFGGSGGG